MTGRDPLDDLATEWRDRVPEGLLGLVQPEALERRARRLARQVMLRNASEWMAAAFVVVLFGGWALSADRWLTRFGAAWTVAAALWVAWVLWVRGRNLPAPALDAPTGAFLAHQREQLERQALLLERVPTWYALPLASGTAIILADHAWALWRSHPSAIAVAAFGGAVLVVMGVYLAVLILNRRAARSLRAQLSRLSNE